MLEIKRYNPKYKEDVRKVCLNTAYDTAYEPVERNYLLNSYCDYYINNEPDTCFVAIDENDTAQGYVICAPDFERYKKLVKPYVIQGKKSGFDHYYEGIAERSVLRLFSKNYPAHFHIDINEGFQNMGVGSKLITALFEQLENKKVKGVMLTTGSGNTQAINFYKKHGFKTLILFGPAIVMGKKLR